MMDLRDLRIYCRGCRGGCRLFSGGNSFQPTEMVWFRWGFDLHVKEGNQQELRSRPKVKFPTGLEQSPTKSFAYAHDCFAFSISSCGWFRASLQDTSPQGTRQRRSKVMRTGPSHLPGSSESCRGLGYLTLVVSASGRLGHPDSQRLGSEEKRKGTTPDFSCPSAARSRTTC
jgi:hypothetical protein